MKSLIIISIVIYLILGFIWHLIFTYKFKIRARIKIKDTILEKDLGVIETAIICLFWIFIFPFILKDNLEKNKEDKNE